ncbi:EKC/KEOPS complex subunit [Psilocybe cubensis]|uniref:EKC/KEOPS complex subunit CGI121 n=2 Tax=Psilocybe cubensis TaxID=181762 RepID=A0A8H7Y8G3_PSICU|nr:EKC/KEOPS complex subunit [Psilocybe cubensis]KAH9487233.1 EKC/KEOPS complex subunit [Psilocybe cubensis]
METLQFPHFQSRSSRVHFALFRNVSNSSAIKSRIIEASTIEGDPGEIAREAVNFAFISARLITSRLHLETAIHQAILADSQNGLRTKTVHSEILYIMNPTHNITEAIRRFGVSNEDSDLILVRVDSPDLNSSDVEKKMREVVSGDLVAFSELEKVTDWASVKKYFKLNSDVAVKGAAGDPTREKTIVDNIVISFVAMKNVMQ